MTTLQHALDRFESNARIAGHKFAVESNDTRPLVMLAGSNTEGLRLNWCSETRRLVIAITNGPDQSCLDWLDLYDMVIGNTNKLPADHDISVIQAIEHGFEIMAQFAPKSQGG